MISTIDEDGSGFIEFNEFVSLILNENGGES